MGRGEDTSDDYQEDSEDSYSEDTRSDNSSFNGSGNHGKDFGDGGVRVNN
jgi:hypothetical protein